MFRFYKIVLCLLLAALTICAAGCGTEEKKESSAAVPETKPPVQATTVAPTTQPATTVPRSATSDSVSPDEGNVTYNGMDIKKNVNEIETTLDNLINTQKFMGSVYVKIGNDFEYIKAKGFANQGAHLDNSIYRSSYAGSLTKLFTATAVMKLAEEKKLSLDDTLDKFFSGCAYGKEVTVRQLLTMTSGIPNYLTRGDAQGSGISPVKDLAAKLNEGSSYEKNKATILNWILSQPRKADKENTFAFSDSNYYLLGEIIGSAAQVPYETYLEEQIFKPTLMNKTGFEADETTARPYDSAEATAPLLYEAVGYSSMGVITNVSDVLKFIDALSSRQLIGEKALKEMTTDAGSGYGCGAYISGDRVSCSGEIDAYSVKLSFTLDKRLIFAAMSNYASSDPSLLHRVFSNYLSKYRN